MISSQKHLFDLPEGVTYLNCSYMSPQLLSVSEAGRQAVQRKERPWEITESDFFEETDQIRNLFAGLVDAQAGDIAIIPSASYGLAVAAKNLPIKRDSKIILLMEQFPSNVLIWQELANKQGAETIFVEDSDQFGWTGKILETIDKRTAIVALPHAHWTDGRVIDLEAVGRRCRELNVALVLDLTQSVGAQPFSVQRVQPDFMIAATYKWLLGPYSMGFLYVHPKHQQGLPIEHNWINRCNSEDFTNLVHYQHEFQAGARRYDVGERTNFVLMPMLRAALTQLLEWQIPNIAETLSTLCNEIAKRALELGLQVAERQQRCPHFLGLGFPNGIPAGLLEDLRKHQIFVSIRGNSMRVSPHLYNTKTDIEKLFTVLGQTND